MQRLRVCGLAAVCGGLLAGAAAAAEADAQAAARAAVDASAQAFTAAFNRDDASAVAALWTTECTLLDDRGQQL